MLERLRDGLVLGVWGAVALGFILTGRAASYLHPSFHPWLLVSGIVLLALAASVLIMPKPACEAGCACGESPSSTWLPWLRAVLLTGPLLATLVISPSQFGPVMVHNRGLADSLAMLPGYSAFRDPALPTPDERPGEEGPLVPLSEYLEQDAEGRIVATVADLLYAANIPELRRDFEGREIVVVGQFLPAHRNNPQGDRFSLVRMFILCCAADARPLAIPVQFPHADFPSMSWVEVRGIAKFPFEGGRVTPVVEGRQVAPCEPPTETFLY